MNGSRKLAAFVVCLFWFATSSIVWALPVGVVAEDVTDALASSMNLWVGNIFIDFDNPADILFVVGGADIKTNAPGGFYQHQYGGDFAPAQAFIDLFPSLKYDSFVTISFGAWDGPGATAVDPDFSSAAFNPPPPQNNLVGGWYAIPGNGQGAPDENLRILIAQLTIQKNYFVFGSLYYYPNNGWTEYTDCFKFFPCTTCTWDLNCDGSVNSRDLSVLLGAWGPKPCHPADFNGDGTVNSADQAALMGHWGACPS